LTPVPTRPPQVHLDRPPVLPREPTARFKEAPATAPWGYIYGVTNPNDPGFVKLGRSKNPYSRMSNAQTFLRTRPLVLEFFFYVEDDGLAEEALHEQFAHARYLDTEWFEVPLMEAYLAAMHLADKEPE